MFLICFRKFNKISEHIPQDKNPIKRGSAVVPIYLPIRIAIGIAKIVEINPLIAAPIPAICPIGCIANALTFPKINPIDKNCSVKNNNNVIRLGFSELKKISK